MHLTQQEAASIARAQVEAGAKLLDINVDDGMIDSLAVMTTFINYISSDSLISKVVLYISMLT